MAKRDTRRTKVFWTGTETQAVVEEAANILSKEPVATMKSVLARAQVVLPEPRRRPLYSSAIAELSKRTRATLSKRATAEKEAAALPAPLPERTPDSIIEDLSETIGRAFAELFVTALRASITHTKAFVERPETLPTRPRLPKLTIVGLLPNQKNAVLSEFGEHFELRFWKDESPHTLRSLTKNSDAVICMSDWISHGHQDLIKGVDPKKLRLVPGTVTRLRDYLSHQIQRH